MFSLKVTIINTYIDIIYIAGFGSCLLRKQSLFVLQKYFNDSFHSIEIYLKSTFYIGSSLISLFLIIFIRTDFLATIIIYILLALTLNCLILLFYKNPVYDKAMTVSKYEILDNEDDSGAHANTKDIKEASNEIKRIKIIGESSKEVYNHEDLTRAGANPFDEDVQDEASGHKAEAVIYEYGKGYEDSTRKEYIIQTVNNLNKDKDKDKDKNKDKVKIVDNTARSRLMATFAKDTNRRQRYIFLFTSKITDLII